MSIMKNVSQQGSINILLIPFIAAMVFLVTATGFGYWAYMSRQVYKNQTEQIVSAAVALAVQKESDKKDKAFAEAEKLPLKTYLGPQAYGNIMIKYPKTWSSYVDDSGTGDKPIDGYFYPGTVPSVTSQNSTFALRIEVDSQTYSQTIQNFTGQIKSHMDTIAPYALPNVPSVIGAEVTGKLDNNNTGIMVVLPLRAGSIKIWTEGDQFTGDFNNIILKNFTFTP